MNRNTRNIHRAEQAAANREVERMAASMDALLQDITHSLRSADQEKKQILAMLYKGLYSTEDDLPDEWDEGFSEAVQCIRYDIENDAHWQAENE